MNTFVTESGPLHHLHRAGYVVAPEMVEAHHADALIENVERCKTCGGYGVIPCPCCNGEGCYECGRTTEVYCADCGGYDLLPVDAANEAIKRVDARPENAAILRDQRELAVFATEAARLLSGDDLARAIEAHADDLRKRAAQIPTDQLDWDHMYAWEMHAAMGYYSPFHCPCCLIELPTHAEGCLLDEPTLEATRARLLDLRPEDVTPEGLDLYTRYLLAKDASR